MNSFHLGTKSSLDTDGIYHFGNIPSDEDFLFQRRRQLHHFKTRHHHLQFQGCLGNIQINNQLITFDTNVNNEYNYNIKVCYENEESGVFLNGQKEIILGKKASSIEYVRQCFVFCRKFISSRSTI